MALAYKIRDARTYEWDVSEAVEAGNALRKALTEALAPQVGFNGLTEAETNATMSVMGLSATKAAQPVRVPLTAQVLHDFSPIFGGDK
jgi:hypothetical protein